MTATPIGPGTNQWIKRWRVHSERTDKAGNPVTYVVARNASGEFACSCPAWKLQRGSRDDCKHITSIRRIALMEEARVNVDITTSPPSPEEQARINRLMQQAMAARQASKAVPSTEPASKVRRKFRFEREESP